jgi:uncharacterized membrane protein YheB (UPF0754 family)
VAPEPNTILLQFVVTVGVGAVSGGLTNAVAIWMLFHPYEPRKVLGFTFHGAIPKNKERLAKSIGKTVGERLLTPEDLERELTAPGIHEAFVKTLDGWLGKALTSEYGSVRELLPPTVTTELEHAAAELAPRVADRMVEFAGTGEFREAVRRFLVRQTEELGDRPVGTLLTDTRQAQIRELATGWVDQLTESPEIERAIRQFVERQVERLANDPEPLLDRLPPGLIAAVEAGIRSYLPVALERLAGILAQPDAKERIKGTVHGLFQRFTRDLLLHERLVAKLVVSEKTVGRLLDSFERDGVERISQLLDEPAMRTELAKSVNDAVVSFLRKPMKEHLQSLEGEKLEGVKKTAADYVVTAIRDQATRTFVIAKLDEAMERAEGRTFGDLLRVIPPERAADWLQDAARSDAVRGWVAEGVERGGRALLDRRIGRPAALLPEDAPDRIVASLADPLWAWIRQQVPTVVAQLSVRDMVEAKVRGFSIQRMEEIIRGVTQRELDLIVKLGYVLGGLVGLVAFGVNLLIGVLAR